MFPKSIIALSIATALMAEATAEANGAGGTTTKKKQEKPKISVQMKDGRTVEFPEDTKAKKAWIFEHKTPGQPLTDNREDARDLLQPVGVRWDFSNGETRTILLADLAALAPCFTAHGVSQKGGDEYASEKDVDDAVIAFDDLMDRLKKGEWSEQRGGGGFGGASVLAKAISEVFGKSMEETRAFLRDLKPQEKMALRQTPELKPTIEKIEAEKASGTKVDTAALLAKAKALQSPTPASA